LKHSLSKLHNKQSSLALIEAALGALYSKANSPNASPGTYVFKNVGSSYSFENFLKQSNVPSSITYKIFPASPYLITQSSF